MKELITNANVVVSIVKKKKFKLKLMKDGILIIHTKLKNLYD